MAAMNGAAAGAADRRPAHVVIFVFDKSDGIRPESRALTELVNPVLTALPEDVEEIGKGASVPGLRGSAR